MMRPSQRPWHKTLPPGRDREDYRAPGDALAALHAKVDRALVRLGLAPERRAYLPHITLARLPRASGSAHEVERFLADRAGLASPPFILTHLTLLESRLGERKSTRLNSSQ